MHLGETTSISEEENINRHKQCEERIEKLEKSTKKIKQDIKEIIGLLKNEQNDRNEIRQPKRHGTFLLLPCNNVEPIERRENKLVDNTKVQESYTSVTSSWEPTDETSLVPRPQGNTIISPLKRNRRQLLTSEGVLYLPTANLIDNAQDRIFVDAPETRPPRKNRGGEVQKGFNLIESENTSWPGKFKETIKAKRKKKKKKRVVYPEYGQ